jgi:hypothetical protein
MVDFNQDKSDSRIFAEEPGPSLSMWEDSRRLSGVPVTSPPTQESVMKYLCLVYVEEKVLNAMAKPERQSLSDESMAFCDDLQKKGQLIAASPLHPIETATTVRVRNGKTSATDGPFAETKEQLGGFLAIDVRDLNDAIRIAAHFPAARFGSIEVRPMKELGCAE